MLLSSITFYLFFSFFDGPVICVDSPSYIQMDLSREPLYPIFLSLFRFVFGNVSQNFYLFAIVLVQSILAAVAAWSIAALFYRKLHLSKLFSLLVLCVPLAVSLLCRFAAARGSMYSNSILTEGISISCYLLFFRFLFEFTLQHTKKALFASAFLSFLLISTRKQMIISLLMLILCIFFVALCEKKLLKGTVTALICSIGILLCNAGLDVGYNFILRGEAVRHSSDTRFITTIAFYTANRDDCRYIKDKNIQNLFLNIYDTCDEKGYLKIYAGKGWQNRVAHFSDCYDRIQIDTMWSIVNAYAWEYCGHDVVNTNVNADFIMNTINTSILPHNTQKIAETFLDNFLSGLVTTTAQMRPFLIWYSLLIYLLYFLLLLYHMRRGKNYCLCLFAVLTLLSIFFNAGLVSLVIFCQTRYTIYNMPLFYISLLLMLYEPARKILKKKSTL